MKKNFFDNDNKECSEIKELKKEIHLLKADKNLKDE